MRMGAKYVAPIIKDTSATTLLQRTLILCEELLHLFGAVCHAVAYQL
jgi:hypothetical protein